MRSRLPPTCCSVDVMNGGFGRDVYGLVSTLRTVNVAPSSRSAKPRAAVSSSTTTSSARFSWPKESKSLPSATFCSLTLTRPAVNCGSVGKAASRSQYAAATNAMRSRSRSTTSRTAGDCTRPADSPVRILRQHTSDTG